MTRDELAQRVQNYFANPTYYSSDDLNSSIQDGYDEIGAFTGLFVKSAVIPYQASLSYYDMIGLLSDYIGVVAIFSNPIKRWLQPISQIRLDKERIDWETAAGVPYFFSVISHRYMAIYKKPITDNYGDMYIFYRASSPILGAADLFAIPDDYLNTQEDYVITDLWEQNQEWTKAKNHLAAYIENLQELRKWIHSQRIPDEIPSLRG